MCWKMKNIQRVFHEKENLCGLLTHIFHVTFEHWEQTLTDIEKFMKEIS
jgi:hypothetical protein